jgi:hypothetical protein
LLPNLLFHLFFHLAEALPKGSAGKKKGYYQPENELKSKIGQKEVKNVFHGKAKIGRRFPYCFLVKTGGLLKFVT